MLFVLLPIYTALSILPDLYALGQTVYRHTMIHRISPHGDTTLTLTTTCPPTQLLVSSPHLIHASPYFQALLTGHFREAVALRQHGHVEVTLPEDDPDAMRAVMNAVHGRFWAIPGKNIRLELLKDIAVVVDKYGLEESVCTMLETWTSTARVGKPPCPLA